jgi:hypothetical protein
MTAAQGSSKQSGGKPKKKADFTEGDPPLRLTMGVDTAKIEG